MSPADLQLCADTPFADVPLFVILPACVAAVGAQPRQAGQGCTELQGLGNSGTEFDTAGVA